MTFGVSGCNGNNAITQWELATVAAWSGESTAKQALL